MFSEVEMCFEKSFWEEMTASLTAKQNKPKWVNVALKKLSNNTLLLQNH